MKKLLLVLLAALSLTAVSQEKKTVAVLDPICRDNSVNAFYQQMVRGAMESAVTASSEYEAYDRSAFDQIQKEQAFQRTGAVSDSQIKKMGELAGVDYVLVSEVSAFEGYMSAIVKILNVTTGKYDKSADDYTELRPDAVKNKCREMASSLFGAVSTSTSVSQTNNATSVSTHRQVPEPSQKNTTPVVHKVEGYVDLGLPSGTLWNSQNEPCGLILHDKAMSMYGNNLPTKEQWEELISSCVWTWTGNGYNVMGPNNKTIFLSSDSGLKKECYWSSTTAEEAQIYDLFKVKNEKQAAKIKQFIEASGGFFSCLYISSKSYALDFGAGGNKGFVRLVK